MSTKIGRLVFRQVGDKWNVYYALPDTMDGAIYLATMSMDLAQNPEIREAFIGFMHMVAGAHLEQIVGQQLELIRETPTGKDRLQ